MNVAHVVTLVSQDGAFGGPVSVALAQAEELARRGHQVTLFAGWDGHGTCAPENVSVSLHRVRRVVPTPGFSGLVALGLVRELRRKSSELDAVHVHLARDMITLRAAWTALGQRIPLVLQTHGMVQPDGRAISRVVDSFATRRVLRSAASVAALTVQERDGLLQVAGDGVRTTMLGNGIAVHQDRRLANSAEFPVVLFCARLHPRKRVLAFAQMALVLIRRGIRASFVVAGPDEGDLRRLQDFIADESLGSSITYIGAIAPEHVRKRLREASIYVLPSEREPFPMTLLEAMAEGTPAVITDGCMIAEELGGDGGVVVTDGTPERMADAVAEILGSVALAESLSRRARDLAGTKYGIASVVDRLEALYTEGRT